MVCLAAGGSDGCARTVSKSDILEKICTIAPELCHPRRQKNLTSIGTSIRLRKEISVVGYSREGLLLRCAREGFFFSI